MDATKTRLSEASLNGDRQPMRLSARAKTQVKRCDELLPLADEQFSYTIGNDGIEKFVVTPDRPRYGTGPSLRPGGGLNLGGSMDPVHNAVDVVELAVEKGASIVLLPVSARKQLNDLSDDMATKVSVLYYSDPRETSRPSVFTCCMNAARSMSAWV